MKSNVPKCESSNKHSNAHVEVICLQFTASGAAAPLLLCLDDDITENGGGFPVSSFEREILIFKMIINPSVTAHRINM